MLGITVVFLLIATLLAGIIPKASAQTGTECKDVLVVFLRGSGQNPLSLSLGDYYSDDFRDAEGESYTFFNSFKEHFEKDYPHIKYDVVSIHDFPGKYSSKGYRSAPVGTGSFNTIKNTLNAEISLFPGDYRDSVDNGVQETVGYLKDQVKDCPGQSLIVGGYSQGAQVMGDSLFKLSSSERENIIGVGFFGDPKYIGAIGDKLLNPFDNSKAKSFPWRRGDAGNRDTGILDARMPYLPGDMAMKSISYCFKKDLVCAGYSALGKEAHSHYGEKPIPDSVNELIQKASSQLLAYERSRGGINEDAPVLRISQEDLERHRDVMFLFNDNSNDAVLQTFRYSLDPTLSGFLAQFTETRLGVKSFAEHDYGFSTPRVDNIQALRPYEGYNPMLPNSGVSNIAQTINAKYPFGQPIIGGGDLEDPYQLALQRAIVSPEWSVDNTIERNVILITDRPPKDPYKYDICNGIVRQWMHFPDVDGYKNCYTNFTREVWQKSLIPETCETIQMVIFRDTCTNPLTEPSIQQFNQRSLDDIVKLAQAYNTKISIVIPGEVTYPFNALSKEATRNKLRDVAYATGGEFIYYSERSNYSPALLYDTLYQVFTKQPHTLQTTVNGQKGQNVELKTDKPVIFDVSTSGVNGSSYKWDFDDNGTWDETTEGPLTETEFTTPITGLMRIQALNASGSVVGETRQAYTVALSIEEDAPIEPALPAGLTAIEQSNGTIVLAWNAKDDGNIVIIDKASRAPLVATSLRSGGISIPAVDQGIEVRVINEDAVSKAFDVEIHPYVESNLVEAENSGIQNPGITLVQPALELENRTPPTSSSGLATAIINRLESSIPERITIDTDQPTVLSEVASAQPASKTTTSVAVLATKFNKKLVITTTVLVMSLGILGLWRFARRYQ